uniref:NADH-ubiquinone oxidoreductase chain 1 n=1 Tax=Harpactocrates apennicola TaxID=1110479 RepID=A0A516IMC7_9ARAC|nr:NADH dehydrogenase subunit 1 [Harpactocrates apennicola]QDP17929.1 NADH dehydrogenase subunit 1 [Harpactocrates apennicola]
MINIILTLISLLLSVAFYTLLERKILSYIQMRKGPNKVSIMGIMQPFSDAIKLFNKTLTMPSVGNSLLIFIIPSVSFMLSLIMWPIIPFSQFCILDNSYNSLIFFVISSLMVYSILTIGWCANSKFSQLGSMRAIAQMISYEINFFMMLLMFTIFFHSYKMSQFYFFHMKMWLFFGILPIFMMWLFTCLAEVNRSPFDFAEGESELVSGFNVEFAGGLFALIFLSEYMSMILMSFLTTIFLTGSIMTLLSIFYMNSIALSFLWIRGTFPRFRYDLLMKTNWKIMLPITTLIIITAYSFIFLN